MLVIYEAEFLAASPQAKPCSAHLSQMLLSALKVAGVATAEHDCWGT